MLWLLNTIFKVKPSPVSEYSKKPKHYYNQNEGGLDEHAQHYNKQEYDDYHGFVHYADCHYV